MAIKKELQRVGISNNSIPVNPQVVWRQIQKKPNMSEKQFLEIVRKLKRDH